MGSGSEVKDLTLSDLNILGNDSVGGVAGVNDGGTVLDCKVQGNVNGVNSHYHIGGIVGLNDNGGIVQGCSFTGGTVKGTGTGYYTGGIVGFNSNGTVESCFVTGNVAGDTNVGGMVGWNVYSTSTVRYSYATGNVTGSHLVGGVTGENDGTVEYCYSTGVVAAAGSGDVGGVVGSVPTGGIVRHCFSTGDVTGTGDSGGVAGRIWHDAIIEYCYATGNVYGGGSYSGGIVATQLGSALGSVQFCVALNPSVRATGVTYLKRVIGYNGGGIPLNNNYARIDMDLFDNTTPVSPTPAEMTTTGSEGQNVSGGTGPGEYNTQAFWDTIVDPGWNFSTIWEWGSNNLPALRGMP